MTRRSLFRSPTLAFAALLLCGTAPLAAQQPPDNSADALSGYLRTLAGDPRNSSALLGAGRAALEIGDPNAAVGFYARAAEGSPRSGAAKAGLGAALVQLQQPQRALSLFAEAASLGLAEADFAADRGLAYDLTGDNRRAQRDYATALKTRHDDETARRYALSLGITGDRAQALALLDPLIRRRDPAAWRARAFVLALNGNVPDADAIARAMLPSQAEALHPFLVRLASLTPAQKAAAVTFGDMPTGSATQVAANAAPAPQPMIASAPVRTAVVSPSRRHGARPTAPDIDADVPGTSVAASVVRTPPDTVTVTPARASVPAMPAPPPPVRVATTAPAAMQTIQSLPSTVSAGSAASLNGGALQAARDQLARITAAKAAASAVVPVQTASLPPQPAPAPVTPPTPAPVPIQTATVATVVPPISIPAAVPAATSSPTVPVQSAMQTPPVSQSPGASIPAASSTSLVTTAAAPAPTPQAIPAPGPMVTAALGSSPREIGASSSTSLGGASAPLPPPVTVSLPASSVSASDVPPPQAPAMVSAAEAPRGPVGPPAPEAEPGSRPAPAAREAARVEPARRSIPTIGAPRPVLAAAEPRARTGSRSATPKAPAEEDVASTEGGRKSARRVTGKAVVPTDKAETDDATATTSSARSARASAAKGDQLAQSETLSTPRKSATRSGKRASSQTSGETAASTAEDDGSAAPSTATSSKKAGRSTGSRGEQLAQAEGAPTQKTGGKGSSAKTDAAAGDDSAKDSAASSKKKSSSGSEKEKSGGSAKSKSAAASDDGVAGASSKSSKKKAAEDSGAASRVYVQVAGGANRDDLDKAWAGVKRKAPDLMKGKAPSTTPLRFTNRLLVGPFKDEDEAQSFVNKMAGKGLSGFTFKSAKGQKVEKIDGGK